MRLLILLSLLFVGCGSTDEYTVTHSSEPITGACYIVSQNPNRTVPYVRSICYGPVYERECGGANSFFEPNTTCYE